MTIQERLDLRDRAVQCALNFAGRHISSADGSYDLLISVIQDAMDEWASVRVKAEREACLTIAVNTKENYRNLRRDHGEHAAFIIQNLIRSRTDRENAKTEARKEGETTRMLITQAEFDQAMDTAVRIERAACAQVAKDRESEIGHMINEHAPDTYIYNRGVSQMDECNIIENRIRARSEEHK
jgi:hypothetical protein